MSALKMEAARSVEFSVCIRKRASTMFQVSIGEGSEEVYYENNTRRKILFPRGSVAGNSFTKLTGLYVFLFLLLLLPIFSPLPALSAPLSAHEASAVDAAVASSLAAQRGVGVAVGVLRDNKIAYLKGYGYADREKGIPVKTSTQFRWASVSKLLTAVVALQLFEKGELDLARDIRTYVPEYPDKGAKITPRLLLVHQSGIGHYGEVGHESGGVIKSAYASPPLELKAISALDPLVLFKDSPLIYEPGQKYHYSTFGYLLLSAVVERAGKQPFRQQIEKRIAGPLGMKSLRPDYQWEAIPERAVGYRLRNGQVVTSSDTDVSWKLGGGGYISNIGDLARFAEGLLNNRLVSKPTEGVMWSPAKTASGEATEMGLGFFVESSPRRKVWHNGQQEKTSVRLVLYPDDANGVVVMSNSEYLKAGDISTAIYKALSKSRSSK
jgi:serine beta-lactamase-like protein LACTB, mitochondrial